MNLSDESLRGEVKQSGGMLVFLGIGMVILGFLAIGAPLVTGVSVAIMVGIVVLLGGILQLAFAFKAPSRGSGILLFIVGLLTVVCGLYMLGNPIFGLGFLTLLLAAYLIVDGAFEAMHAFQIKPRPGWGWMLFSGIVSVLLGFMIWRQWPVSGVWAIGLLLGIRILLSGWSMIALGMTARSLASRGE
jgi:uncharacterized membrane protein HdeD (DUF308 family)